jgi:hypothetical protein
LRRDEQQIKLRAPPVDEEQVFEVARAELCAHGLAIPHGQREGMFDARIRYAAGVEQGERFPFAGRDVHILPFPFKKTGRNESAPRCASLSKKRQSRFFLDCTLCPKYCGISERQSVKGTNAYGFHPF